MIDLYQVSTKNEITDNFVGYGFSLNHSKNELK